jgi:hypothetical protein
MPRAYSREQKEARNARERAKRATPEGKAAAARWEKNRDRDRRREQQRKSAARESAKMRRAEYYRSRAVEPEFKAKQRAYSRKHHYGMTNQSFLAMLEAQQFRCAVCGADIADDRRTHVDHCHKTGLVRGLLCPGCNTGIGVLEKHDGLWAVAASKYLGRTT